MSSYRIITDGKQYKVQQRHLFWWSDEGHFSFSPGIPGMQEADGYTFQPYVFNALGEAERHIQNEIVKVVRCRRPRWRVVKVIHK